jgi:ribonuclease HI
MADPHILVFADGSAKGNPGPGGWGALVVTPAGTVTELGGGAVHTTNNKMELTAAIEALKYLRRTEGTVAVYTDSTYVIRGITQWIKGWQRRGWKTAEGTPVLNRDYWETLAAVIDARGAGGRVSWHHVPGHAGIPGNERVDEIADGFATHRPPPLYRGPLAGYAVPVLDIPAPAPRPARTAAHTSGGGRRTSTAAYSYLSVVGGQAMRHATWAECERRVKGVSGARFKKAMSAADETAILRGWGFSPDEV